MNKQELMMKAVCDLRGDLDNNETNCSSKEKHLWFNFLTKEYITSKRSVLFEGPFTYIGLVEKFNNLVAEPSRAEWIPEKVRKPTYTKQMQESGQAPLIGMKVLYPSGSGELALGADNNGICIIIESGVYKRVSMASLMPILTPEQKAAKEREDAVNKIMECNFLRTCNHQTTKDIVRSLYDAGLLKTEV